MTHTLRALSLHSEPPLAPVDPWIGQTLDGRYFIESVLGEGGMGLVYKAKHVILGKRLAIKVLKPSVSKDAEVMARFRREAQSASAIGSPHIIDISDFGTMPDGATYFVMEYLDGLSLSKACEQERPMRTQRIVNWAKQVCDALGAAHDRGIVHRDLKPDNVYLVQQGHTADFVKILDFGIAKVGSVADKKLTQAGQVFGTPHYMSPEQCAGREVDHRTDIYALGVMLYEAACGHVPFDADSLMGVLTKHVYEAPIPFRQLPEPVAVDPGLEAIILKCLAKTAEARYQRMPDLHEDLVRLEQGGTPAAVGESLAMPRSNDMSMPGLQMSPASPAMAPAPSRTGLIVAAALGLVLAAAGAFAIAFFVIAGDAPVEPIAHDPPPVVDPTPTPPPVADPTPPPVADPTPIPTPVPIPVNTTCHLQTDPPGAEVYRDTTLLGNTPLDLQLPADGATEQVSLRMQGYRERTFMLSSATASQLSLSLDPVVIARRPIARPTPQPLVPQARPLAPVVSQPRRPSTSGSDIVDPW